MTCTQQETCKHYHNGSKRRPHHIRITDICQSFIGGKCKYGYDLMEGEACSLEAVKEKKEMIGGSL